MRRRWTSFSWLAQRCGMVGMAEELAHHVAVLAYHQGIIVAVPGTGLGELDAQFFQPPGDLFIDVCRAVVGVEPQANERAARQQGSKGRDEIALADALDTDHRLKPGHLIDHIGMIHPFFPSKSPWCTVSMRI